mgnify:CR=1 FL=1
MAEILSSRDPSDNRNRLATEAEVEAVNARIGKIAADLDSPQKTEELVGSDEERDIDLRFVRRRRHWEGDFFEPSFDYTEAEMIYIGPEEVIPDTDISLSQKIVWSVVVGPEAEHFKVPGPSRVSDTHMIYSADELVPEKGWDYHDFTPGFDDVVAHGKATLGHVMLMTEALDMMDVANPAEG